MRGDFFTWLIATTITLAAAICILATITITYFILTS